MGGDTDLQDDSDHYEESVSQGWLVVVHGGSRGTTAEVPAGGLLIGRQDADAPPRFLNLSDALVSRHHARVHHTELGWRLTDLGSRNRGAVNGVAFEAECDVALPDNAVVRLGNTLLVFRHEAPPLERVPRAPPEPVHESSSHSPLVDAFPGTSRQAVRVRQHLAILTVSTGPVLIVGETGTGKEHIARALQKADAPYLPVNCAQLGKELAAAELFGHARNAFTGATGARAGLVEKADGGVLFLDEIGELEYEVQAMLLRFLEDGYYRPVGSTDLRKSTARVVAATNVDLEAACARGTFRADLLARLSTATSAITLPALRDRREDLLAWAERFWREQEPAGGAEVWSTGAAESLLLYPWPRNLRELRGAMNTLTAERRARAEVEGTHGQPPSRLERDHLPERIRAPRVATRPPLAPVEPRELRRTDPTRDEVLAALHECEGNVRQTARRLMIDRRKLYRLFEKYGIHPREDVN